jgi:CO/xanthine dehydrogenase FAD-binding subunit
MFRNLPKFEYLSPRTIEEATSLLKQYGSKARVIAGGTDLVPRMKWGEIKPEYVLSLSHIPGLQEIQFDKTRGLSLGALCKIGAIERSDIIKENYPLLAQAASVLGSKEIRNLATVGGNLCNGAPSADMPPALLALGARAVISFENREKVIPLEDFFVGPKKTILGDGELLVRLEIPRMSRRCAGEYIKVGKRKAMEIAMIGVASLITLEPENNTCKDARLGLATAAPTPIRARQAEEVLVGKELDDDVIELATVTASKEASPRTSWRSSEEYRRELIRALTRRAIKKAIEKIGS